MVLQISEINIIKHESSDMSFDENKEGLISCALQFNLIWNNKQGIPVTILLYIYILYIIYISGPKAELVVGRNPPPP